MEILSYVLEGRLAHQDSMGGRHTLGPNEVQAMSAGTGVIHSEFNASPSEPVHFLQIWMLPDLPDREPSYQQIAYPADAKRGRLRLMAAPAAEAAGGVVSIHQDARMYGAVLGAGDRIAHNVAAGRHAWIHCATGHLVVNGLELAEGDGLAMSDERSVNLSGAAPGGGEVLLFDLA
jgi:redox-sensitive bicupin YhaK (pirin superfamily)